MSMKITDIHVMESQYNQANNIPDIIANLKYPQKYLKLRLDDKLYDLELVEAHEDKFILEIEQKCNWDKSKVTEIKNKIKTLK